MKTIIKMMRNNNICRKIILYKPKTVSCFTVISFSCNDIEWKMQNIALATCKLQK